MIKTCCLTGHKKIEKTRIENTKVTIHEAVIQAINEGYTHFISGFADGIDLYFAEIVVELKKTHDISLEAVIPYRNKIRTKNANFQRLLAQCDSVEVISEVYFPECYINCNRFMVGESDLVVVLYDGREKGGTLFTMRYAHILDKTVKIINI